jgi:hypothetical protein
VGTVVKKPGLGDPAEEPLKMRLEESIGHNECGCSGNAPQCSIIHSVHYSYRNQKVFYEYGPRG